MANKRRDVNPIDVVEAAYDLDTSDAEWLHNMATAVRPLLDGGAGMISYVFDATMPPDQIHARTLLFDLEPSHIPDMRRWAASNPAFTRFVHFNNEGLLNMLELCRRAGIEPDRWPMLSEYYKRAGLVDYLALQTIEPGGQGVVFAAGQRQVRPIDTRTHRLWNRVTAHIAAGRRLRAAIAANSASEEAILTPSGAVEHAAGEGSSKTARESLREAVKRVEKARGKQRKTDPEGATEAWTAMVSGRWSLVDRFERSGRRYIVARRNEHALPDPRALTPRERVITHLATRGKSNKLIGYELGLSESAIGSHLSQAMRKLGVTSRVDLIQLIAQLGEVKDT